VHEQAKIAENVTLGPYCQIGPNAEIAADVEIGSFVIIDGYTQIGPQCKIFPQTVIGTPPQDLKYANEPTRVIIGARNTIREFVTIHRGTATGHGQTVIGDDNLIMAYCHIAHDCIIGSNTVMANAATLAGHVVIGNHAIIGGLCALHQFSRVGDYAILGGASAISQDVVPYSMAVGNRATLRGLNLIGLRRHGFSRETISLLKKAIHFLVGRELNTPEAVQRITALGDGIPEIANLLSFIGHSKRGICRGKVHSGGEQ